MRCCAPSPTSSSPSSTASPSAPPPPPATGATSAARRWRTARTSSASSAACKHLGSPQGHVYDLERIFDELNARFFHGLLARPRMTWSRNHARQMLGHYDPAHNAIVVSRSLDRAAVPRYVVEYLVYHEMLHLKHPVRLRGSRRSVHPAEFVAEEKLFPHLAQAKRFLATL